jgi:2'-5' RNA ligase
MRLFVGLAPSAAALDDLDAACAPLRRGRGDLRWTSRELWHITLAFLGEVSEDSLAGLLPRLERAARRHLAFGLNLAGAGAFPSPARANVLWGGLSGDKKALGDLAMSVGAGARRAGAPPPDEGRRYRPHVTLARCRMPADVRTIVAELSGYQGPAWTAGEIYLIRSTLGGQVRYETLGSWQLSPGRRPPVPPGCAPDGKKRQLYRARDWVGDQDWLIFSRMGAASRSTWRSSGLSSWRRCASQASRRRRTRCTRSLPSGVTVSTTCLRSVACGARRTRPRSSSTAITRVMDGGCTFSCSASSPGVIDSWRSSAASAASWMSERTVSVPPSPRRSTRRRRASLLIEIRMAVASPASVCKPGSGIHQVHHAQAGHIRRVG